MLDQKPETLSQRVHRLLVARDFELFQMVIYIWQM